MKGASFAEMHIDFSNQFSLLAILGARRSIGGARASLQCRPVHPRG